MNNLYRALMSLIVSIQFKLIIFQRYTDWFAAGELIKGVYEILSEHPFIVHIPHFKALISTCQVTNFFKQIMFNNFLILFNVYYNFF